MAGPFDLDTQDTYNYLRKRNSLFKKALRDAKSKGDYERAITITDRARDEGFNNLSGATRQDELRKMAEGIVTTDRAESALMRRQAGDARPGVKAPEKAAPGIRAPQDDGLAGPATKAGVVPEDPFDGPGVPTMGISAGARATAQEWAGSSKRSGLSDAIDDEDRRYIQSEVTHPFDRGKEGSQNTLEDSPKRDGIDRVLKEGRSKKTDKPEVYIGFRPTARTKSKTFKN